MRSYHISARIRSSRAIDSPPLSSVGEVGMDVVPKHLINTYRFLGYQANQQMNK